MSKITLEDGAQIVVESIDCLLLNDANYEDEAETLHQIAALIRKAQKLVDAVGTPIQHLPILDGNEFLSCAVCGDDWLRGEPEQHMPECALVAFRKEEEVE
jgi:hypothetical protein